MVYERRETCLCAMFPQHCTKQIWTDSVQRHCSYYKELYLNTSSLSVSLLDNFHTCYLVCCTVASIQGYFKTMHSCSFFLCICYKYKDKKMKCPLQYSQECFSFSLTLSGMTSRVWWLMLAIALNILQYTIIFSMIMARHTKSTVSHRPTSSYSWWPSVALVGLVNRRRSPSVWEITVIDWWAKWIGAQDKKQK